MSPISQGEKESLIALVRHAGQTILSFREGESPQARSLSIETKSDGSSVTAADYASNEILVEGLKRIFPADSVHSEEIPASPQVLQNERVWIIDPLDGTKAFISGKDDFSVLVSLVVAGEATAGLMFFPALQRFAIGFRNGGASCDGRALGVSKVSSARPKSIYVRHFGTEGDERFVPPGMDSGRAFLAIAAGEIDGAILRVRTHHEWDVAAPAVIIRECGGMVTDEQGAPIKFDRPLEEYGYVVASNGTVHDELLDLIRISRS